MSIYKDWMDFYLGELNYDPSAIEHSIAWDAWYDSRYERAKLICELLNGLRARNLLVRVTEELDYDASSVEDCAETGDCYDSPYHQAQTLDAVLEELKEKDLLKELSS